MAITEENHVVSDSYKICVMGDFAVGKTSLITRIIENTFSGNYETTIGVQIRAKMVNNTKLMFWDIIGRNKYENPEFIYLNGSHAHILVADGTRALSLDTVIALKMSSELRHGKVPSVLLINKIDLKEEWQINDLDIVNLKKMGMDVVLTSAIDGSGIEEVIQLLLKKIN